MDLEPKPPSIYLMAEMYQNAGKQLRKPATIGIPVSDTRSNVFVGIVFTEE